MKNSCLKLTLITAALILTGCSAAENGTSAQESVPPAVTSEAPAAPTAEAPAEPTAEETAAEDGSIYVDFENGASPLFECSDGWSNGSMFNCTWRKGNNRIITHL